MDVSRPGDAGTGGVIKWGASGSAALDALLLYAWLDAEAPRLPETASEVALSLLLCAASALTGLAESDVLTIAEETPNVVPGTLVI
ncbi:MAG: hypothetical protein ABF449_04395 [Ethanoligenens sp.]